MREKLFEVLKPETGHSYVIYTDGSVEGFGEGKTFIFNRYEVLRLTWLAQRDLESNTRLFASPANSLTSSSAGAEHGTPP